MSEVESPTREATLFDNGGTVSVGIPDDLMPEGVTSGSKVRMTRVGDQLIIEAGGKPRDPLVDYLRTLAPLEGDPPDIGDPVHDDLDPFADWEEPPPG